MNRAQLTGQRKHDMRLGKQPKYVDATRSAKNTRLSAREGYDLLKSSWSRFLDREEEALASRRIQNGKNRNMWRSAILTFGHEAQAALLGKPPEAEAKAVFEDFAKRHRVRLLWAIGHHDESAVHYHAMFENIRDDGHALRLGISDLSREQDIAASHLSHLGLIRGKSKKQRIADGEPESSFINRSVKQLHADLPAEIEAVEEKLAKAMERADKAEAKAKRFEGDADVALARLERYQAKIKELEHQLAGLNQRQVALQAREISLASRESDLDIREHALADRQKDFKALADLISGVETPQRTAQRHEEHRRACEMPIEDAVEADGWKPSMPGFLRNLKARIGEWWENFTNEHGLAYRDSP